MDLPTYGLWRERASPILVSEHRKDSFLSVAEKKRRFTMPPRRRDMQTPDPLEEREMSRRRGRQMTDPTM
jgi:hypothetical protein